MLYENENEDELLNNHEETQIRSGSISEAEYELQKSVARKLGWVDKEEWKRDPESWTPADQFLESTNERIERLKESKKRIEAVADKQLAEDRIRMRAELDAEVRKAVREGNEEAAVKLVHKNVPAETDPRIDAWVKKNPWFSFDTRAHSLAVSTSAEAARQGLSIEEQLEAVDKEIQHRFPEHFDSKQKVSRTPPLVQGGSSGGSIKPKNGSTWEDIPLQDRRDLKGYVTKMHNSSKGKVSEKDAMASIAKTYWKTRGN